MSPTLVVFDWDGTLSDSRQRIVDCFRRALATIGAHAPPDDRVISQTIGLELPDAAAVVMPGASRARCAALTRAYRDHWLTPGAPHARLFEDARACLESLRARGATLAVATGKSRRGLDRELAQTEIGHLFTTTRCADETRGKPDPQMLTEILEHTGVPAEAAVMVGDTTYDLQMARAAAVPAVAIASGTHSPAQLAAFEPLACLPNLAGLAALLFTG